jgi:superfamily I DNA/RNA helicase
VRILSSVIPTAEQLPILNDSRPGFRVIRGAAGSGKTTTALLRLKQLCATRLTRRNRLGETEPVRVLVLTYNTTLQGYIAELARSQVAGDAGLILNVSTFSKWAKDLIENLAILDHGQIEGILRPLLRPVIPGSAAIEYFLQEVEYVLSMFLPEDLPNYLGMRREGRGGSPRIDRSLRERLLNEVIYPYEDVKLARGKMDWNDLALEAIGAPGPAYDIVIIDEAQDFSANQVRAVISHLADDASVTFVIDAVQRIYPRFFRWNEVGVTIRPEQSYRLTCNHRNTRQIAAFALPLVENLPLEDDGSLPDFTTCEEEGPLPEVVSGTYSQQLDYMLDRLIDRVDLNSESVAILQPKGGGWFAFARKALQLRGIPYCELTRQSDWPAGPANVGISTIHSAKGLEFDHVLLPGMNREVTPHGLEEGDGSLEGLQRLFAMGVGRARRSVIVGCKPGEESTLISLLDPATYTMVKL